jgi:hypothetical protein
VNTRSFAILGLAVVVPASGCDWRKFDELSDTAWAKSTGSPGDLDAGEWGVGLAFGGGAGDGVTFVGAGQRPDGVGTIVPTPAVTAAPAGWASESGATNPTLAPAPADGRRSRPGRGHPRPGPRSDSSG